MPTTPSSIAFNFSSTPPWAQSLVNHIDTAIGTGWGMQPDLSPVRQREFEFSWNPYGGWSQEKIDFIRDKLLPFYRERGWRQAHLYLHDSKTNATKFTLIFEW